MDALHEPSPPRARRCGPDETAAVGAAHDRDPIDRDVRIGPPVRPRYFGYLECHAHWGYRVCRVHRAHRVDARRVWSLERPLSFDLGTRGAPGRYRIVLHGSTRVAAAVLGPPKRPVVPRHREYPEVNFHDCRSRLPGDETMTDLSGRFVRRVLRAMPATLRSRGRFGRLGVPKPHRIGAAIAAHDHHGHDHHGHDHHDHYHHGPCRHGPGPGRRRTAGQSEVHEGRRIRTRDPRGERRSGRRTDVPSAVPHRLRGMGDLDPRVGRIRPHLEVMRIQTVTADHRRASHCLSGDHPSIGILRMFRSGYPALRNRVLPAVGRSRAHLARRANPRSDGRILRRVRCSPTRADWALTVHPTTRRGDLYDPRNLFRRLPLVGLIGMVAAAWPPG